MTRGESGWLLLLSAGLPPAVLRQLAWRTPEGLLTARYRRLSVGVVLLTSRREEARTPDVPTRAGAGEPGSPAPTRVVTGFSTTERRKRDASGTSADDDPSSRCRPFHSPSRSHVQPLCCRFRARLPHSANVRRRTFAPLGLLLFRTRQTRPSPFGCHGSGYRTFALNQDAPIAVSHAVTVPPPER